MSLPSMELAPIVPAISRLQRGASRISANFYGKTGPFGLISAGFWPFWLQLARDGVLIWRAKDNVLSASPGPRPSLSRPSARCAGDWGWRKEAH